MYVVRLPVTPFEFTARFFYEYFHFLWLALPVWGIAVPVLFLGSAVVAHSENITYLDSLYMCSITFLTVGYGDIVPHTHLGRIMCVLIGYNGIVTTGIQASFAFMSVKNAHDHYIVVKKKYQSSHDKLHSQQNIPPASQKDDT